MKKKSQKGKSGRKDTRHEFRVRFEICGKKREGLELARSIKEVEKRYEGISVTEITDMTLEKRNFSAKLDGMIRETAEENRKKRLSLPPEAKAPDYLPGAGLSMLIPSTFIWYLKSKLGAESDSVAGRSYYGHDCPIARFLAELEVAEPIIGLSFIYYGHNPRMKAPTPGWVNDFYYSRGREQLPFKEEPTFDECYRRMLALDFKNSETVTATRKSKNEHTRRNHKNRTKKTSSKSKRLGKHGRNRQGALS